MAGQESQKLLQLLCLNTTNETQAKDCVCYPLKIKYNPSHYRENIDNNSMIHFELKHKDRD